MKFSAWAQATTLRTFLHLAAVLAVIATFSLFPGAARAQSETGPTPTPTATALAAPQLTAIAFGDAVKLNWTPVPGVSRYELHAQLVDDPGRQRLDQGDLTATTHTHRDLVPGAVYQYAVRALDANGVARRPNRVAFPSSLQTLAAPKPGCTHRARCIPKWGRILTCLRHKSAMAGRRTTPRSGSARKLQLLTTDH